MLLKINSDNMNLIILRLFIFALISGVFTMLYWVYRESFGRFVDKIFPFPYLREGGNYKYNDGDEELTPEGFIVTIFIMFVMLALIMLIVFEFNLIGGAVSFFLFFPSLFTFFKGSYF